MRALVAVVCGAILATGLLLVPGTSVAQETPSPKPATGGLQFPRITGAGGVYALPDGTDMPTTDASHRLLIDARDEAKTKAGHNVHLETAARAVNLYALAGVPPERVRVAIVVHGKATPMVLSDVRYAAHFGKPHPDAALISKLRAAGVEFFVCGQALLHRGYRSDEVRDEVLVSLSAMTKLVELQAAGYGLIP